MHACTWATRKNAQLKNILDGRGMKNMENDQR